MRPTALEELTRHYAALLGERLVSLALYGSRARGDARDDSDLDLFLVAEGLPKDPWERARSLPSPRWDVWADPQVSIRALTPEELERDIAPVDLDIAVDARILFDRGGYLSGRLATVRERIAEAGLVRGPDLFWRWTEWPSRADWEISWQGVRR
jgi:predicted nucleotidyltransferase